MDFVRSAYVTRMRFGDTPESERTVRWQFVPPGTPLLDRWTVFNSLQWGRRVATTGPGEVVGAPRPWNRGVPLPWPYGAVPCGTESEWLSGFGSGTLPELPLGPDGVPTCCGAMPPVPVAVCPDGMPAMMYGRLQAGTFGGPPAIVPFFLNHVPSSSPATWSGVVDWSIIGGSGMDMVSWSPEGTAVIEAMRLVISGCDNTNQAFSQNIFTSLCAEATWTYFYSGGAGCAPGISLAREVNIQATPFS